MEPTVKIRNNHDALAFHNPRTGLLEPVKFCDRKRAETRAAELGEGWTVYQGYVSCYVIRKPVVEVPG